MAYVLQKNLCQLFTSSNIACQENVYRPEPVKIFVKNSDKIFQEMPILWDLLVGWSNATP